MAPRGPAYNYCFLSHCGMRASLSRYSALTSLFITKERNGGTLDIDLTTLLPMEVPFGWELLRPQGIRHGLQPAA